MATAARALMLAPVMLVATAGCDDGDRSQRVPDASSPDAFTSDGGTLEDATVPPPPSLDSGGRDAGAPRDAGLDRDAGDRLAYLPSETFEAETFSGYVVHDNTRDRDIPILVRHPRGAMGPLPVALFSPGGTYVPAPGGYSEWGTVLARAGYFTINLSHPEAPAGSHCAPLGIPANECDAAHFMIGQTSMGGTLNAPWYHRPMDARAVLDDLPAIAEAAGVTIDLDRIAMVGHSGGAYTTMAVAGARIDYSPSVRAVDMSDPRPRAFLANSPQGVDYLGLTATSWDLIVRPVMTQTGRSDRTEGEEPAGRLHAFMHMPPPDKYLTYLDSAGATHSLFGLGEDVPDRMLELYVGSAGVAFLDAYVRDVAEARTWLGSGRIDEWSGGVATITSR